MKREANGWAAGVLAALLGFLCLFGGAMAWAVEADVRLGCTPRTFRVLPGEPVRLELCVVARSGAPVRLQVPADPRLVLRAVEKLPVERNREGAIVHRRVVIWQALEPGEVKIDALSVETQGRTLRFPEITITVRDPGP
ncbi:MAG: hypothetical protein ACOY3P_03930 [Planctomycetota bacterium]